MSNAARLGIVALAVVLAVVVFIVLRPPEESEDRRSSDSSTSATDSSGAPQQAARPAPAVAGPTYQRVAVRDGGPVGEVQTVSLKSGETVRLAFRSDAVGEVHIHGYDRYVDLKPGRTVRTSFPAKLEGIFEVEEHGSGEVLARLRVEP